MKAPMNSLRKILGVAPVGKSPKLEMASTMAKSKMAEPKTTVAGKGLQPALQRKPKMTFKPMTKTPRL